jgi:hypothetical protein
MRMSVLSDDLKFVLLVLLAGCALISCSENEDWYHEGLRQVWVDSIGAPDSLHMADTLVVMLWGEGGCSRPDFSHIETVRDSFRINLTVWADCYEWTGSGHMPPTNIWVDCESKIPPPFYPGRLLLVAYRPDSTTVSDTVAVVP